MAKESLLLLLELPYMAYIAHVSAFQSILDYHI
jgi:hypothetical protein